MAEQEMQDLDFDPSLKKKKKKKTFDLDAALGDSTSPKDPQPADETVAEEVIDDKPKKKDKVTFQSNVAGDDLEEIDLENFGLKKKKKKKKDISMNELGVALPEAGGDSKAAILEDDLDLENFGKKKKKKKRADAEGASATSETTDRAADDDGVDGAARDDLQARLSGEQDYTYDQLLSRVFTIIRNNNPELATGEKRKFVMRPPQVVKVGTKKTAFVNFNEISKMLHRQPKHLLSFIASELGTVGTCDGSDQLILKGRFTQKHMENVLRRYIKEYVTCHTCRSPDTLLNKETRLFFLQCMSCHSRCSVQTIKTGFQAVTSKRSLNRNK